MTLLDTYGIQLLLLQRKTNMLQNRLQSPFGPDLDGRVVEDFFNSADRDDLDEHAGIVVLPFLQMGDVTRVFIPNSERAEDLSSSALDDSLEDILNGPVPFQKAWLETRCTLPDGTQAGLGFIVHGYPGFLGCVPLMRTADRLVLPGIAIVLDGFGERENAVTYYDMFLRKPSESRNPRCGFFLAMLCRCFDAHRTLETALGCTAKQTPVAGPAN
jgi:hypothetical protein